MVDKSPRPKARPNKNKKTEEYTTRGRPVWEDSNTGDRYSEITTTMPWGDGWITAPTVDENGERLSEDEVREILLETHGKDWVTGEKLPVFSDKETAERYAKWRSDTMFDEEESKKGFTNPNMVDTPEEIKKDDRSLFDKFSDKATTLGLQTGILSTDDVKMAKGGTTMEQQMELFENGGLRDQGQTRDPVSGNNVPVGSMQKEVRDDVPAMLSEGEFVLPADVVRYIGLDRLMKMRQDAKQGLENMNRMGQFGNSEQAVIPDNLPYNQISPMAQQQPPQMPQQQMAQGGVPNGYHRMPNGQVMPNSAHMNRGGVLYAQTGTDVVGQQFQLLDQQGQGNQPDMIYGKGTGGPTFSIDQGTSYIEYINPETFERIQILGVGGVPREEVPEGFIKFEVFLNTLEPEDRAYFMENGKLPTDVLQDYADEFGIEEDIEDTTDTTTENIVTSDDGGPSEPTVEPSEFQKAGSWKMDTSGSDGTALQMWIEEAQKTVNLSGIATGVASVLGGGLLGTAVHFANKAQKNTILEMIDAKIAQAKKTPIEGQVAALQALKDKLEGKGEKTGLSGVVSSIIDKIGDALGLGDKEKEKTKVIAGTDTNTNPKDPSKEVVDLIKQVSLTDDDMGLPTEPSMYEREVSGQLTDDDMGLPTEPSIDEKRLRGDYAGSGGYDEVPTELEQMLNMLDGTPDLSGDPTVPSLDQPTIPDTKNVVGFDTFDSFGDPITIVDSEGKVAPPDRIFEVGNSSMSTANYIDTVDKQIRDLGFSNMEQLQRLIESNALTSEKMQEVVTKLNLNEKTKEIVARAEKLLVEQGKATPEILRRVQVRDYLSGILKTTKVPTTGALTKLSGGITPELANSVTNYLAKVAGGVAPETAGVTAAKKAVDDLLTTSTGERVSESEQRDIYYKAVEEKERLAKLAAEAAAAAKRAADAAEKKRLEAEAKRLADEAAKKAAEESAALGGKSSTQILYESLDPAVQTKVAASDEEKVMSQPVGTSSTKENTSTWTPPTYDDGSDYSSPSKTGGSSGNLSGLSTQTKTDVVKSKTSGLTSTEKKGGAGLDTAMGISGLNKGGLATPVFKSTRKPDTTRGLAARKK